MSDLKNKVKPVNSASGKELEKVQKQFEEFDQQVKNLTMDRMSEAPKEEVEAQTKLSQNEIAKSKDVYLNPVRTIASKEKFNERFRDEYNYKKEYVMFIAENREVMGDVIETWTKPFSGMPAEFWHVPPNKPVWGPRYLAERIKECSYHRLIMQNTPTEHLGVGTMYGQIVADTTIQRLDAIPASKRKSIFMGASGF